MSTGKLCGYLRLNVWAINRPTFGNGTAGDVSRSLTGAIAMPNGVLSGRGTSQSFGSGPFITSPGTFGASFGAGNFLHNIYFDISWSWLTGPENAPRTLSVRYWRRVA